MSQTAQQIMQQHGKTFALAAKLLSPNSRKAAAELYAFARTIDDMIDLQAAKPSMAELMLLMQTSPINHILQTYAIEAAPMQAFLQSQMQDAVPCNLPTEQTLINYAYGVAGSIGAMMRPILGAPKSAENFAVSLGIAMQLTNIARDVVEDANRSRVYLPATFFVTPVTLQQFLAPTEAQKQQIFTAIQKLLSLADAYYDYAKQGYAQIPLRNRLSIITAANMYQAIGKKILKNGAENYWQGRVSLNLTAKIMVAANALCGALINGFFTNTHAPIQPQCQLSITQAIRSYTGNQ